jgi:hypothetical protein
MKKNLFLLSLSIIFLSCNSESQEKDINNTKSVLSEPIGLSSKDFTKEYSQLEGNWQSNEDKNYFIKIKGRILSEISNGKQLSNAEFKLYDKCMFSYEVPKDEERIYIGYYIDEEKEDKCFFEIIGLSDKNLTLMYLVSGNITYYTKNSN